MCLYEEPKPYSISKISLNPCSLFLSLSIKVSNVVFDFQLNRNVIVLIVMDDQEHKITVLCRLINFHRLFRILIEWERQFFTQLQVITQKGITRKRNETESSYLRSDQEKEMRSVSEVRSQLIITLEKRQYPLNNDYCYHLHDLASKPMDVETEMSSQGQQTEVHLTMKRIPYDLLLDLHSPHSLKKILLQIWLYSCTSSVWLLSFETILESPSWTVQ